MAVAISTAAAAAHSGGAGGDATPKTVNVGTLTVAAGDTAAYVGISSGVTHGSATSPTMAATVTLGGVSMTAITASKVFDAGNTDEGGITEWYELLSPSAGATQTIAVTVTWTTGASSAGLKINTVGFTVTGSGTAATGGHATSANAVSSITAAVASMGTGDLAAAIGANGTSQPGVTTGTAQAGVAGGSDTGSDNIEVATNTGTGTVNIVFSTNNTDESQASWIRIPVAAAGGFDVPLLAPIPQFNVHRM